MGWGRTVPSDGYLTAVADGAEVADVTTAVPNRGAIARGLARSYGDAAQNAGGAVLSSDRLRSFLAVDVATGVVKVGAGVSIDDLINRMLPFGWFVPVTPGTRYVTVGGAIAADIHGKNHHVAGAFGAQVVEMTLVLADGSLRTLSPEADAELFWATVGGMGLTGMIMDATVALKAVETSRILVDTERTKDIDELMATLSRTDHRYTYSVAWIDSLARGAALGRSVVTRGDFAKITDLPDKQRSEPLAYAAKARLTAPPWFPNGLLNKLTVAAFNEMWYRKAPVRRTGELQTIPTFFHPLDGVRGWNRVYGTNGFLQYQYVVPYGSEEVVKSTLERISSAGAPSFLAVLKRLGDADPAPLSFPTAGWTLALDIPAGVSNLAGLLDSLDDLVVEAGGRVYLAKDSRLRPELIPVMYPRLPEWRAVRDRVDPHHVFTSDLARRLSL